MSRKIKTCIPVTGSCTYRPYNALFTVFKSAILSFLIRPSPPGGRIQDVDWVQIYLFINRDAILNRDVLWSIQGKKHYLQAPIVGEIHHTGKILR